MRFLIITLFTCLTASLSAQQQDMFYDIMPIVEGEITYTDVVKVDSISSQKLFIRGKKWFSETYNSAKDVIQFSDKEAGEIMGRGFFETHWSATFYSATPVQIWYEVRLQFKDGRYKYTLTDFRIKYYVPSGQYNAAADIDLPLKDWNQGRTKNMKKFLPKVHDHIISTISLIEATMSTAVVKDDW